ncbi:hybrid sensor histidine kinase/response regulator [Herbaspirillum robiniae]|uniref:histidine kinase n=1 Tax=Herbaspirillum robiniae TaxID=2014887 RepID=A0A246WTZ6_9BURK|nr:response regulator [Herbaspirillum robiniae]OWY30530.1 hybrid sensor histidine kinase/response regulator [Herbaspirillum robiniae]
MSEEVRAHVLILEDDEGLLALASRVLKKHGHRVTTAAEAEAARAAVAQDPPDLLIVDYNLQALDTGLDFFRSLRASGVEIPAIMVSGVSDEPRIIEALRAGVADVLPKTSDYLDYLPEAVDRLLNQLKLQRQAEESARMVQQEQYYRMVSEAIPHLVWSCLPDGEFDYLSKQWLEYTGVELAPQLGLRWIDLVVHPDDRAATRESLLEAVREERTHILAKFRLRRHDGQYRWFTCNGSPLLCSEGHVQKWLGTCTDIDDLKRSEHDRELLLTAERVARAEAERMTRVKDEFVATLSHELRTPLNAIIGWTQYLLRDPSDGAKLEKGLQVIERNAKLQAQMVEDLLDMSRILSGKLRLDVQRVDMATVIDDAIASVQAAADAKEIRLVAVLGSAGIIHGDPSRLQQVVWNLLMNAIKFTPKQGRVSVSLRKTGSEVELEISDNGQGIKPEFLGSVFDRFSQEDASLSRAANGLGLGLSITRQLVELHGGSVRAASEGQGQGASFYVSLPLAAVQDESAGAVFLRETEPEIEPELSGLHVLLVEDEVDARELVQRILEERGATVDAVGSADEALDAFRHMRPNVIVSDIGLPGQDGYEFMRSVRALESSQASGAPMTPAAALTALARTEDRRRALMAGFQAHIAKPVDPLELLFLIASLSGRTGSRSRLIN